MGAPDPWVFREWEAPLLLGPLGLAELREPQQVEKPLRVETKPVKAARLGAAEAVGPARLGLAEAARLGAEVQPLAARLGAEVQPPAVLA